MGAPLDLTIDLDGSTSTACGDESDVRYLSDLGRVSSYSTDGGELRLYFADETGAMRFTPQGS